MPVGPSCIKPDSGKGCLPVAPANKRVDLTSPRFSDSRIQEIALDWYAQADDGAVWYLGEDVADYKDGVIYTHEGTWLAGRDGPAAMIMPARLKVGGPDEGR